MRQVVLDTETTGLSPAQGHRVVEIGCVELINRKITGKTFQVYINPNRKMDIEAVKVCGITDDFLQDKPRFGEIVDKFLNFVSDSELIIHNAPFDIGFLNNELSLLKHEWGYIGYRTTVLDTLEMAKKMYPGQRNNLDALCKRLNINNSHRHLHGALLDSEILAEVYLAMTSGQVSLLKEESGGGYTSSFQIKKVSRNGKIPIVHANEEELTLHNKIIETIEG